MIFLWFLVVVLFWKCVRFCFSFLLPFVSFCCMHLYFMLTAVSYQMLFHWCSFMYPPAGVSAINHLTGPWMHFKDSVHRVKQAVASDSVSTSKVWVGSNPTRHQLLPPTLDSTNNTPHTPRLPSPLAILSKTVFFFMNKLQKSTRHVKIRFLKLSFRFALFCLLDRIRFVRRLAS